MKSLPNRLFELLNCLSPEEYKELKRYLNSPFFGISPTVKKLLEHILKVLPNWDSALLEDEQLHKVAFPDLPFRETRLNRLRFSCFETVKSFLVYLEIRENEQEKRKQFLEILNTRNAPRLFYFELKKWKQYPPPKIGIQHYLNEYQISRKHLNFSLKERRNSAQSFDFEEFVKGIELLSVCAKLEYYMVVAGRKPLIRANPQIQTEVEDFLQYLRTQPIYHQSPVIAYYCIELSLHFEGDKKETFEELKLLLPKIGDLLEDLDRKNLYQFALNFCSRRIQSGDLSYQTESYNLYKTMLAKGIFKTIPLSYVQYKNIIILSLRFGEYEWVEKFIEQYKLVIPMDIREDVYYICVAIVAFYKEQYTQTLHHLLRVKEAPDVFFNLEMRRLFIKTYYELGEWSNVQSQISTFRVYLHRNKLVAVRHLEIHRTFLSLIEKLINLQVNRHWRKIKIFHTKLSNSEGVNDKAWLLAKLTTLIENEPTERK